MLEIRSLTVQDANAYWALRMEALTLVPEAFAASISLLSRSEMAAMANLLPVAVEV